MKSQSSNTAARPSDAYPDCPACDSHGFVDGTDYAAGRYYCHACGQGFVAPDGYTPPDHERQRGDV